MGYTREKSFTYYNVIPISLHYYNAFYYTSIGKGTHAPSSIPGPGR